MQEPLLAGCAGEGGQGDLADVPEIVSPGGTARPMPAVGPPALNIQGQLRAGGDLALSSPRSPPPPPTNASAAGMALSLSPVICSQSVWLILLSLNAIGPFSSDAYLPNLPEIDAVGPKGSPHRMAHTVWANLHPFWANLTPFSLRAFWAVRTARTI